MNNDNRIRNRILDIYSDLARYTHMNQIQTNDTLQQIESGIRELSGYGRDPMRENTPRYSSNRTRHTTSHGHTNSRSYAHDSELNPNLGSVIENLFNTTPTTRLSTIPNNRPNDRPTDRANARNLFNTRQYSTNRHTHSPTHTRRSHINNRNSTESNRQNTNTRITQLSNDEFMSQFFNIFNTDVNNLTPVIVRPTHLQITNATESITIRDVGDNTMCPILQRSFQANDQITRIKHCRHCFIEEGLLSWFNQSVLCPVCRFDIRDYSNEPTEPNEPNEPNEPRESNILNDSSNNNMNSIYNTENTQNTSTQIENNLMNIFTNQLSNTFQQYLTGYDSSFNGFNNLNNGQLSVEYYVQTPNNIYTTERPSRLFVNNNSTRRNNNILVEPSNNEEDVEDEDEEDVEDVEDVELSEEEYIAE